MISIVKLDKTKGECPLCGRAYQVHLGDQIRVFTNLGCIGSCGVPDTCISLWVTSIIKLDKTKGECPLCGRVLRPYHVHLGVSQIFAVDAHAMCLTLKISLWVTSIIKLDKTKGECPLCGRVLRPYHVHLGVSQIFAVDAHAMCLTLKISLRVISIIEETTKGVDVF